MKENDYIFLSDFKAIQLKKYQLVKLLSFLSNKKEEEK